MTVTDLPSGDVWIADWPSVRKSTTASTDPTARNVVLSPASHFANRDQPEAWNRAALAFLKKVDGRARR